MQQPEKFDLTRENVKASRQVHKSKKKKPPPYQSGSTVAVYGQVADFGET